MRFCERCSGGDERCHHSSLRGADADRLAASPCGRRWTPRSGAREGTLVYSEEEVVVFGTTRRLRRCRMYIGRVLYWLLTGMLIGFGVIAILSIGFLFLLLGLIGVIFGAIRL